MTLMGPISKTTITVTVLHLTTEPLRFNLEDVLYEIEHGNAVGAETGRTTAEISDADVADELIALGNDGTFFDEIEE